MAQSGGELEKLFANDKETARFIDDSMKQYKTLTNYIGMLPTNVTSFDDAITFPKSAFKVQQAASRLNVALWSIRQYCAAMQERLAECQRMSEQYIATVRDKMPQVVGTVLIDAYNEGLNKGKSDAQIGKHSAPQPPKAVTAKPGAGGATLLANAMALALAQGYYDAGKTGPTPAMAPLRAMPRCGTGIMLASLSTIFSPKLTRICATSFLLARNRPICCFSSALKVTRKESPDDLFKFA